MMDLQKMSKFGRSCASLIAGGVMLLAMACSAAELNYDPPVEICRLENRDVNESSGLGVSRRNSNYFWTHNDSGDRENLYCFDRHGIHIGTTRLKKADAEDWEDMCSYVINGQPRILVADTGDNGTRRKNCRLYVLEEPQVHDRSVRPLQEIKLKYSTGPIDCEAVGVDAVGRKILFVEKRKWITCRVYMADLPDESNDKPKVTATPIARINLPIVTAMDVSADGTRAIVLTLGQAFEFQRAKHETWKEAFSRKPRTIDMPPRKQGEAICYGSQGRDLYLTSEFAPCPFYLVKAKGTTE